MLRGHYYTFLTRNSGNSCLGKGALPKVVLNREIFWAFFLVLFLGIPNFILVMCNHVLSLVMAFYDFLAETRN